jgi:phosphotransferase system HPr (HPr) family protein
MAKSVYALSREATINNELGLHARAAAKIAALAQKAESKIWLLKNEEKADASSILDILTLGCPNGTKIMVSADEYSDIKILDSIVELVQRGFEE